MSGLTLRVPTLEERCRRYLSRFSLWRVKRDLFYGELVIGEEKYACQRQCCRPNVFLPFVIVASHTSTLLDNLAFKDNGSRASASASRFVACSRMYQSRECHRIELGLLFLRLYSKQKLHYGDFNILFYLHGFIGHCSSSIFSLLSFMFLFVMVRCSFSAYYA